MLIAQISDLHVKSRGTRLFGTVDAYAMAEAAFRRIEGMNPRPEAILISGDLTNDGTDDDYGAVADLIGRVSLPVFVIPGNHDRRETLRTIFSAKGLFADDGPMQFVADLGPLRLIGLDSLVDGANHGELGPDQLTWLDGTLADAPQTPTLVMVHHPPFVTGIGFMDAIGLRDADALARVIARHGQVERVLTGHVHRLIEARFAGTIALACPGAAHQVALDLGADAPPAWTMEPPAILLHWWNGERVVTHLATVADFGEPRAFSDDHARAT